MLTPAENGAPPALGTPISKLRGRVHLVANGFMAAGTSADLTSERSSALVYLATSSEDFEVEAQGQRVRAGAALVRPRVPKRFYANAAPFVCLDIFPPHRAYRAFASLGGAGVQALPREHFDELIPALREFASGTLSPQDSGVLHERVVQRAVALLPPVPPLDPRVRSVMRLLRDDVPHSIDDLAASVHMSRHWLAHLFRREMGISVRKYEQALRIQRAAIYVGSRLSLTEIAALAGFADSAHLSKAWRHHFGAPPNLFFINEALAIDPLACREGSVGAVEAAGTPAAPGSDLAA